ncbi:MAG TPA: alpha/beta hydrolase [Solirubrobacteraceae bacterium]|nr:alpha/beta hydrolase [Solirubrobacteraceae bacterium]
MALTRHETEQIAEANASGRPVVVFVHGFWLLPNSWARWRELFEMAGYATVAPSWPGNPETVAGARADPDAFAGQMLGPVANHVAEVMAQLTAKRALVGHSFGGLLAQIIAAHGFSLVTVAIDPAPFRGVRRVPISAPKPVRALVANPANYGRVVRLTFEQFRSGWANAVSESEAERLYDTFLVAAPGSAVFQVACANLNPWSQASVDIKYRHRGPLLLVAGGEDNMVPAAVTNAAFKLQRRNRGLTEMVEIENRGHSLTIDGGWREVAETVLAFIKRFI